MTLSYDEKDIEDFLSKDGNLKKYFGLEFIGRQVKIDKFYIDILAYSKKDKCFYIIELKKDNLDAKAYVQALRYCKLMSYKYKLKHKFKILMIGQNLHEDLYYHLSIYGLSSYKRNFLYTLYSHTFEKGISFKFHNIEQAKIQKHLEENYYV